ncbi:hypothetical protein MJT46_009655 [Ovis ammon polii x Ovis aries]|nr:hypothetical protein MJT46_009655 [Ovis ammon polii x Ovis aries]
MENDRWQDLDRKCPLQIDQPSASIWECLPDKCQDGALWHREAATACVITNLIKDLSLSEHNGHPSTPPSKRQCRSLSFSDEMASCQTSWRPLGSKFWALVKKRRCYSGGSVQRYSNRFSTMQQSSSFSLPSHANTLSSPYDLAGLHPRPISPPGPGVPGPATCGQVGDLWGHAASPVGGGLLDMQRSLSCSHEQFFAEYCPPFASSTPPRRQSRPGAQKLEKLSSFTLNKENLISHKEYRKFLKTTTVGTIWELKEKSAYVKDEHLECAAAERVICLCALSFNFTENMVKYVT